MGFWSGLGKVLSVAAPVIAAPFTGGASLVGLKAALPGIISGAGSAIGAMGGAASANRGEQDRMNMSRDQLAVQEAGRYENALQNRARLELEQRAQADAERKAAFSDALRSALAMNMQDAKFDRSGFKTPVANISFSGGARPSALGGQGRDAATAMNNSALQRLMNPEAMQELPAAERVKASEPSKASFWEKLAGPLGMGLTIAGQGLDAANRPQVITAAPVPQVARTPANINRLLPEEIGG